MWHWLMNLWIRDLGPSAYSEDIAKSPAQILEEHESYILELQEEKEQWEKYEIVLWWGLDGLKLRDDGTTERISRRESTPSKQDNSDDIRIVDEWAREWKREHLPIEKPVMQFSIPREFPKRHYTSEDIRELQRLLRVLKAEYDILHAPASYQLDVSDSYTMAQSTQSQIEDLRSSQIQNAAASFKTIDMRNAYWTPSGVQYLGAISPPPQAIYRKMPEKRDERMNNQFVVALEKDDSRTVVGYMDDYREPKTEPIVQKYIHQISFRRCGERGYDVGIRRNVYSYPERDQKIYDITIKEFPATFWVEVQLKEDDKERAISIAQKALDIYLHKLNEPTNEEAQPSASKTKQASKLLLSMENEHLEVWRSGVKVCVCYANCEVKDGAFLNTEVGIGSDLEEACEDYLAQIRGKTLVFRACSSQRREVAIPE